MAVFQLFGLALCITSAAALYTAQQPLTNQWDQRNGKGFAYNTDTSLVPFARTVKGDQPDQITITYQSPTSLVINWVVGDGQNYNDSSAVTKPSTAGVQSIVQYSAKGAATELNATGTALVYEQNYNLPTQPGSQYNYTSGIINHVPLTNLLPGTEYYYRVGNGRNWSSPSTFTTLPAINSTFQTYRIGVVADLGVTDNSTITFSHLKESLPDVVVLVGDFTYSNNLYTNGSITSNYTGPEQSYQPLWDQFYRWWSTLTSRVPYFACAGNHEYEQDVNNATFGSYNARFNQTSDLSGSGNSRYYSVDLPGVHFITLSPYDEYNTTSVQYKWLQKDLAAFNRSKTPFLVAQWHAPVYNTYVSHYKEVECARLAWEPLLMQYGVDLVLHGHVHSYERTNRVFNYQPNPCGPMYITVGDGGNLEQLAVPMVDTPGLCPAPSLASSPGSKFQGNCQRYSLQSEFANTTNNGYCPTQQPAWSAYREPSFGHGTLDVSPTQMVWSWHRNQDAEPVTADTFTILPKDSTCNNLNGPAPSLASLAQAPGPAAVAPSGALPTLTAVSG